MAIFERKQAKTENLTVRVAPDDKKLIVEAAGTTGEDVTTFLVNPAVKRARAILDRASVTVLTDASRRLFIDLMEACPSERLIRNLQDGRHRIVE